jgi:hypothetical protein
MTSLAFDTHAAVQKLKGAGFTEQQAEAQVQVLSEIIESNLAIKQGLKEIEIALRRDIEMLRADTKAVLAELKAELIKWNVGAMAVLTAIFAAIVKL